MRFVDNFNKQAILFICFVQLLFSREKKHAETRFFLFPSWPRKKRRAGKKSLLIIMIVFKVVRIILCLLLFYILKEPR